MSGLTLARLRAVLDYDPNEGVFTWKRRPDDTRWNRAWNAKFAGKIAGGKSTLTHRTSSQWVIGVDNRKYLAHRLAWFHHYGAWPALSVDHLDTDSCNNRISNLREATDTQNKANCGPRANNRSGFKGVTWHRQTGKWFARIAANGEHHYLGLFETAEEAHAAYEAAARVHFGHFARGA